MTRASNPSGTSFPAALGALGCLALALSPTQYAIRLPLKIHLSPVDPVIGVAWIAWFVAVVRRRVPFRWADISLGAVLLVVWSLVSVARAAPKLRGLVEAAQYAEYLIAACLVFRSLARMPVWRARILEVFVGITAVVVAMAAAQYLMPDRIPLRVGGTFSNRNVLGGYLSLALPLVAGLAAVEPHGRRRIAMACIIALGCAVNLSGPGLLALSLAFLFMAALRSPGALAVVAVLVAVSLVVLLPNLPRNHASILGESIALFEEDGQVTDRYSEWQAAARMTADHAAFGVGPGNYQSCIGAYYGTLPDRTGPSEPDTQNLYLVLSASVGVPGLFAFASLLLAALGRAIRAYVRSHPAPASGIAVGVAGALAAFLVNAVWAPLLVRGIGIPLAFVLSLAAVVEEEHHA